MKLNDILVEAKKPDGTYAAVSFDEATKKAIEKYIKDNDIPNATATEKLHTTLLYSRKHLPDYEPAGKLSSPLKGTPEGFDVWDTQKDDAGHVKRCLVLKYSCPELVARHKSLMKEHDATYDFDEYIPHITFSYDIGGMDESKLPPVSDSLKKITIVEEYGEDLNLNWAKDSTDASKDD